MAFLDQFNDDDRLAQARQNNPRVKRWVGVRSTASCRSYICYCCDSLIDTESAKHAPTQHAEQAIREHVCEEV